MIEHIFQHPLFCNTAIYVAVLMVLIRGVLGMLKGVLWKNKIDDNTGFSKIDYYYFQFTEFVIAVFAVIVSIYLYEFWRIIFLSRLRKYNSDFNYCHSYYHHELMLKEIYNTT